MIDEAHDVALDILTEHRAKLDALAKLLVVQETLDREEVVTFFSMSHAGIRVRPRCAAIRSR